MTYNNRFHRFYKKDLEDMIAGFHWMFPLSLLSGDAAFKACSKDSEQGFLTDYHGFCL